MSSSSFTITTIHPDIIQTHILTRLDGSTLASAATASPALHHMCTEETLWMEICKSTWSSVNDPRVSSIISTFPAGYRSFYSDSFPTLHYKKNHHRRSPISELISAVDIKYRHMIVYSKVREMETANESPFRVELLDPKENVGMPIKFEGDLDILYSHLKESMTLSWIVIDPTLKRAANVSSLKPVLVQRHCMTGNVQLRYISILAGGSLDFVECKIEVTCGIKEGGELIIKEVKFEVVDMDGECLSGEDSLVILQEAVLGGERRKGEERERERYEEEYVEMKRERRERIDKRRRSFYNFVLHLLVAFILFMITKTPVSFLLLVVALLVCIKQGLSPPPRDNATYLPLIISKLH